jgi:hypothetical protein
MIFKATSTVAVMLGIALVAVVATAALINVAFAIVYLIQGAGICVVTVTGLGWLMVGGMCALIAQHLRSHESARHS